MSTYSTRRGRIEIHDFGCGEMISNGALRYLTKCSYPSAYSTYQYPPRIHYVHKRPGGIYITLRNCKARFCYSSVLLAGERREDVTASRGRFYGASEIYAPNAGLGTYRTERSAIHGPRVK